MPTVLITGANRGIGQALMVEYSADGWNVLATCRSADRIREYDYTRPNVSWYIMQSDNSGSIAELKRNIGDKPIDILWNNAGIYPDRDKSLVDTPKIDWIRSFEVNSIAPIEIARSFVDNVAASQMKTMAFMSSSMGSIENLEEGGAFAYRASKAALNMGVKCLALEYEKLGISSLAISPGWVRTDMGTRKAPLDSLETVAHIRKLLEKVGPETQQKYNGGFFKYDGTSIPW